MGSVISDIIEKTIPHYQEKAKKKEKGLIDSVEVARHNLGYDSAVETLEPVYFFILDLMSDFGLSPEKLIDNFSSSPGSGHFAELGGRATIMQNQAVKVMGDINTVLRSVLNIIYDLKEFRMRLQSYDDLKSQEKKEAAILSLKQIWMDKVDIQKGNSSIKALTLGQAGYVTLIDAFLISKDEKDAQKLDLNDRVKRIVIPRINEFNIWVKQSEQELRKRYELEKIYLRSQVNSLKLYSRWAKPYLKAAYDLESKDMGREPALVKTFNTIVLNLTLLGKSELKVKESALEGLLPQSFTKESFIKRLRKYYSCIVVEFTFRGIPQRVSQQAHFTFGGKADVTFKAYALNEDEINKLNKELDKSDLDDVLKLINGATDDSLKQMQDEINFFLDEKDKKEEKKENKDDSNPFLALFGFYDRKEKEEAPKKKEEKPDKPLRKDDWIEKTHLRPLAEEIAKETAMKLFDVYKKAHGMPSYT
ncbi:MAG: hypothetical protein NTZ83_02705 [Candidatus Pacearchaeota archaeon]|nr:hypothetical protein [Candidatus Pacearchaeota archaeon]